MIQFYSTRSPQRANIRGITVANPPYHSFVVYGDEQRFPVHFAHYKQIGAWYWQTDGVELYREGSIRDSFLHANDDVIKIYHSDVTASDLVIWKGENGPVFQWGWEARDLENVTVRNIDVIHNRMYWKDTKYNTGIFNSARYHEASRADPTRRIKNVRFENVRVEGTTSCAMRLHALSNWENIMFRNIWIEAWNDLPLDAQQSLLMVESSGITITNLAIINYRVGAETISYTADNWQHNQPGRLNFDASLWRNWNLQ